MRLQEFKRWIRRKLGDDGQCTVKVELTEQQIEQALEDAKDWFNVFVGIYRESSLNIAEGTVEYDLSAVIPAIDTVSKVWFPRRGTEIDFSVLYPGFLDVEGIPYGVGTLWGEGYPQTSITQTLQTLESMSKLLSSDLDWEFYKDTMVDPATKTLRIMPSPKQGGVVYYFYRVDPSAIKLENYDPKHLWFIREWALAEAKYTLGRIRGKYSGGLPAAGGDRSLDGEALITESREDKERIEEKILDMQGPVMPMIY